MAEETYSNRILGGFDATKWRGVFRKLFSGHQLPSESLKPGAVWLFEGDHHDAGLNTIS
jgi:hypothetical protein